MLTMLLLATAFAWEPGPDDHPTSDSITPDFLETAGVPEALWELQKGEVGFELKRVGEIDWPTPAPTIKVTCYAVLHVDEKGKTQAVWMTGCSDRYVPAVTKGLMRTKWKRTKGEAQVPFLDRVTVSTGRVSPT